MSQGSVLGPIFFIVYTADLASIVAEYGSSLHQYADDSQRYGSCHSDATSSLSNTVSQCVDSISNWMRSNHLQLNANKMEVMWCSSTRKLSQLPSCLFSVAGALVCLVSADRDLGVFIDNNLGAALTFGELCHAVLTHSTSFVTVDTSPTIASIPWWCRLCTQDLTTATLSWSGFQHTYSGTSSLFSTLVFRLRCCDHVLDSLATLHWLCLPQRVDFKVAVMEFRVLHGLTPPYVNDIVRVTDLRGRRRLPSSSSHQLLVPPFQLTTVGRRTFPVAASLLWNSLPSDIQSFPSLPML